MNDNSVPQCKTTFVGHRRSASQQRGGKAAVRTDRWRVCSGTVACMPPSAMSVCMVADSMCECVCESVCGGGYRFTQCIVTQARLMDPAKWILCQDITLSSPLEWGTLQPGPTRRRLTADQ